MFIYEMSGPFDASKGVVSNPTWDELEAAVNQLNGVDATLVVISTGEEVPHMSIGSGPERYALYVTFDNGKYSIKKSLHQVWCG